MGSKTKKKKNKEKTPAQRWRGKLLGLMLFGALVYLAPKIAANSPLRNQVVQAAAPKIDGSVEVGAASWGWFSPIVLRNAVVRDAQGEVLLEVRKIESSKSLLSLILESGSIGPLTLEKPRLLVALREDGSNLEQTLRPLLAGAGGGKKCSVEIREGVVEVRRDEQTTPGPAWSLRGVEGVVHVSPENVLTARLLAQIEEASGNSGRIETELSWTPDSLGWGNGYLVLRSEEAPLAPLRDALVRAGADQRLTGVLTADCRLDWSRDPQGGPQHILQIHKLAAPQLAVENLGADSEQLRLVGLLGSGRITLQDGRLALENVKLQSNLGSLEVEGESLLEPLQSADVLTALAGALGEGQTRFQGEIDLAQLAETLPLTLRIRQGSRITSGRVFVSATSQSQPQGRLWSVELRAANLAAINEGRSVSWDQPIHVQLQGRRSGSEWQVDRFDCQSDFLQLAGKGSVQEGDLNANADLDQLAKHLRQFIDLGEIKLAGKLDGVARWRRAAEGRLTADGDAQVRGFQLSAPGVRPWREQNLKIIFAAKGDPSSTSLGELDEATIVLGSANDKLEAKLFRKPALTQLAGELGDWTVESQLQGELATWLPRLQGWLPLEGWQVSGAIQLTSKATFAEDTIKIDSAEAQLEQLAIRGKGIKLREPLVRIQTTGLWRRGDQSWSSPDTTLTSSALAFRAESLSYTTGSGAGAAGLRGELSYRADLERLSNWLASAPDSSSPQPRWKGHLTGQAAFTSQDSRTRAVWKAQVQDFVVLESSISGRGKKPRRGWAPLWREASLKTTGDAQWTHSQQKWRIERLIAEGAGWRVETQGEAQGAPNRPRVDLAGNIRYDLKILGEKLRPMLGEDIHLTGAQTRKFSLQGPLWRNAQNAPAPAGGKRSASTSVRPILAVASSNRPSPRTAPPTPVVPLSHHLTGEISMGWTAADVHGLSLGKGEITGRLAERVVRFSPLEIPLRQGRIRAATRIDLRRRPTLIVEPGEVVEQVDITPQMCQSWLKYVAPLLADATRAKGKFSLTLKEAAIPLADHSKLRAVGGLKIHAAQVGPGPLSEEFLLLADRIKAIIQRRAITAQPDWAQTWLTMREQEVPFRIRNGRVHHDGLVLEAGDVIIRTRGWVGLDQSLQLIAQTPIREQWIAKEPLLAPLRGQTLQIPISGTLSNPKVDSRVLENLAGRMIGGAVEKGLEKEVNRAIDRLFGPSK